MTTEEILVVAGIVVAVLVVLGLVFWLVSARRNRHQKQLRQRYGREYDATVDAKGRRAGVEDLDHREEERQSLRLREPDDATRADLRERMAELQFRFVEEPHEIMLETQRVIVDALRVRGYPVAEDRDQALRMLSVDHPDETPPLRSLLESNYGRDVGTMRDLFVDARRALVSVLDVSYSQRDLSDDGGRRVAAEQPGARQRGAGEGAPPPPQGAPRERTGAEAPPPQRDRTELMPPPRREGGGDMPPPPPERAEDMPPPRRERTEEPPRREREPGRRP